MPRHSLPNPFLAMVVALMIGSTAIADSPAKHSTDSLARLALEADKGESANALAELRSMGPEGLRVFLEANKAEIEAALRTPGESSDRLRSAQSNQVLATLDSICQQKDCFASRLYWYTDLEQAKAAARAQGKPILSLRLLGRLDED
jgi:hypothetical protein